MESILPYITGSGGALVVLAAGFYWIMTGKLHTDAEFRKVEQESHDLKLALDAERQAVNDAARTGAVTLQLIEAITALAQRDKATG